jgi:uncharacterized membrane protein YphA (DoxX/SURF4 family)
VNKLFETYTKIDVRIREWMSRYGTRLLRVSLGIIFLWFGALKFFSGMSPAQDLATRTITRLTFGMLPATLSIMILAWECLIGSGLITNRFMRLTLFLLFAQMIGAGAPLLLFPAEAFKILPILPTLEGQYILKNLALVSAGIVIGATVGRQRIGGET